MSFSKEEANLSGITKPALYSLGKQIYRAIQIVVTATLLFALVYGWYWLSDPAEFPIKSVKIQAICQHINPKNLRNQILPYVSQGFIRLNSQALQKKLLESPWVAAVQIQRIWPDTVIIQIVEQQAVARWGNNSLMNDKGQIFNPPINTIPQNLVSLNGPISQAAFLWADYQFAVNVLNPLTLHVRNLYMDERQAVSITLENGTRLLLGKTDTLRRLQRFVKVYPQLFATPNTADYIDLRYENGLAIKWHPAA